MTVPGGREGPGTGSINARPGQGHPAGGRPHPEGRRYGHAGAGSPAVACLSPGEAVAAPQELCRPDGGAKVPGRGQSWKGRVGLGVGVGTPFLVRGLQLDRRPSRRPPARPDPSGIFPDPVPCPPACQALLQGPRGRCESGSRWKGGLVGGGQGRQPRSLVQAWKW